MLGGQNCGVHWKELRTILLLYKRLGGGELAKEEAKVTSLMAMEIRVKV